MKIFNGIIAVVGIIVALAVWWDNRSKDTANELIDEGNAKLELGNSHQKEAVVKLQAVEAADFPTQAEQIRKLANEGAELYAKSGECFRESAAKLLAASEAVLDTETKEYFNLEQKSVAKLAQLQDVFRQYLLVYADSSIQDADTLTKKKAGIAEQVNALSKEYDELKAAATKYAAEHKDKINKPK